MVTLHSAFLRRGFVGLTLGGFVALVLTTAISPGAHTPSRTARVLLGGSDVPVPVRSILGRACQDCHSENTRWPWYAKIPPISWQVHDDVAKGRAVLDFSKWNEYTQSERRSYMAVIEAVAQSRIMPPAKYLWVHREARLSAADLDVLKAWAFAEPKLTPGREAVTAYAQSRVVATAVTMREKVRVPGDGPGKPKAATVGSCNERIIEHRSPRHARCRCLPKVASQSRLGG